MAKTKFKQIFEDLWKTDEKLFQEFFILNNEYEKNSKDDKFIDRFQEIGKEVKDILQQGENDLCRQMEKSQHRAYSSKLADKYWDEVRKYFKYIDLVGVKVVRM